MATLVSLTLTPLAITDGLAGWDGRSEQVPCDGYAILFARSIAAVLPDDLDPELALAVLDVCGAPALTARVVRVRGVDVPVIRRRCGGGDRWGGQERVVSLAAARRAGAAVPSGWCRSRPSGTRCGGRAGRRGGVGRRAGSGGGCRRR